MSEFNSVPNDRIREIRLDGALGKRFGKQHFLAVANIAEGIRALGVLEKGFTQYLNESREKRIVFAVYYGDRNIGPGELRDPPGSGVMRITPVVEGSKNSGGLQTIVGIALVVAASYFSGGLAAGAGGSTALFGAGSAWGVVGTVGISLALGGVAQMVAGTAPGIDSSEAADNQPSYNFSGIKNTVTQGNPVPLCYGEMVVGSACVSLGVVAEDQQ
ncbi:tail assembly protein [Pseudomonas prosekii]|uniref:Phage-related protein, tail component n=1 Tax=Pseudomonas prosekii TaxID=1148509 RepID=A0A1H1YY95_9PSED|nr:tail assembly protein [Pseudomonas prosekii]PWE45462.1 tail assembly protein [Pseudomonas prosekii]SDT26383.1 Phage-related protein, tail component [Pseudomonas prosekii]